MESGINVLHLRFNLRCVHMLIYIMAETHTFLFTVILIFFTIFFFFSIDIANAKIIFQADFESGSIDLEQMYPFSEYRRTDDVRGQESNLERWKSFGNGVVSNPVRSGNYAVKFKLDYDPEKVYVKHQLNTEDIGMFKLSNEYWIGFSVFFPSNWEADVLDNQELVLQFHGIPDLSLGEPYRPPPLALDIRGDKLRWVSRWDPKPLSIGSTPYPDGGREIVWEEDITKGKWIDFVMNIRWSYESDGFLKIWKDGTPVVDRVGPNAYNDKGGTNGPLFGIYKWLWQKEEPSRIFQRIVYHDEVRVGDSSSSYDEVAPLGAPKNTNQPAQLTTPAPNSQLTQSSTTFNWTTGTNVTAYWLGVGTTQVSIENDPWGDIYAQSTGTNTQATVTGIPINGSTLYVRLWSKIDGAWQTTDYTYQTINTPTNQPAQLTTPAPNSQLTQSSTTFNWTTGTNVTSYWLGVGTTQASIENDPWGDIYAQTTETNTQATVSGIPINGSTLYVRLWSKIDGAWQTTDYTYQTTLPSDTQSPTTPTNLTATPISSSQINLSWTQSTDNIAVTGYKIYRDGTQITTVTGTTYQNINLTPSTTYTYTVSAYDAAGNDSGQTAGVQGTTLVQPTGNISGNFFKQHSTWYEKIPANPVLNPNSQDYVDHMTTLKGPLKAVGYSRTDYSSPLYFATESDPVVDLDILPCNPPGNTNRCDRIAYFGYNLNVLMPPDALPASGDDGHIFIISPDQKTLYDMNARASGWPTEVKVIKQFDLTGDGIQQPWGNGGPTDPSAGNASVAAVTRLHGIATYDEVKSGVINHVLAMVMGGTRPDGISCPGTVYPSVTSNCGWTGGQYPPQLGHRFQLDPTLDLDDPANFGGSPLSVGEKVIAKAMQEYGAIYMENGGGVAVYLEGLEHDLTRDWSDVEVDISGDGIILRENLRLIEPLMPGCWDGIDNDNDGFTDFEGGDPQCYGYNDWSELSECSDGLNNDADDLIDYPNDPGCSSLADDDEDSAPTPTLQADLNNDGAVNAMDWSIMNTRWNTSDTTADINNDGIVNTIDWSVMNREWGNTA